MWKSANAISLNSTNPKRQSCVIYNTIARCFFGLWYNIHIWYHHSVIHRHDIITTITTPFPDDRVMTHFLVLAQERRHPRPRPKVESSPVRIRATKAARRPSSLQRARPRARPSTCTAPPRARQRAGRGAPTPTAPDTCTCRRDGQRPELFCSRSCPCIVVVAGVVPSPPLLPLLLGPRPHGESCSCVPIPT